MWSTLRCGLVAVALLFLRACRPLDSECGQVCKTVCKNDIVDGTLAVYIDPDTPEYAPAVAACFADDLRCYDLCLLSLGQTCGSVSFHECTATTQLDGRLLIETDYTLSCRSCTTTCTGTACAPDGQWPPDGQEQPDAQEQSDAPDAHPEADAGAEPDAGATPDADLVDGSLPDAAIDAA